MNEWSFAAEIKSWWDAELPRHPAWRLSTCRVEHQAFESRKRSDLLVCGDAPVLCGELRLPDHRAASPWHPDILNDAVEKAHANGCRWAFTSDSTQLLLIDVARSGPPLTRIVQRVELLAFESRQDLESPTFLVRAKEAWLSALKALGPTVSGIAQPPGMAPDELFINSLRALLSGPVASIRDELHRHREADRAFERRLVEWMVDDQGWTHLPELWDEEIRRAAQLTTYVFATRLMFYEALRRSQLGLQPMAVPHSNARIVSTVLREYFADARERSGDYETIFTWDTAAEFALGSDAAAEGWCRVIEHLAVFDLSNIGYDLLGKMFERLIDPHERYRWGQHYTNPDVVDLMLSLALPAGTGKVLDPAAGGGTFLVRAYMRKRAANPLASHQEILQDLYGLEVSAFAATLATVNLAVRKLDFSENYPQIATRSFFRVSPSEAFMSLPAPVRASLGVATSNPVSVAFVDAVVCNPPYIRIHELGDDRRREAEATLRLPATNVRVPAKLHGSSNYHVFFWLHSARFLAPGGRLVFITAGEWLDSDYGAPLQQWLLENFVIECCIESLAEPWFSEARVGTVVMSVRLCRDPEERAANLVRFVLLRKPLRELFGPPFGAHHFGEVDRLRDRLLSLTAVAGESAEFDWSVISQGELFDLGREAE